jgi:two-component system sensor histidine kinase PhoQ
VHTRENQAKPLSLRLRLIVLAVLLLAISLGLVGFALDAAFHKSSEAGLQTRMESLVYLILAVTEVSEDGWIAVRDDPGDPRLGQPDSGIYAYVQSDVNEWSSPSSLAIDLPTLPNLPGGEIVFTVPSTENSFYTLRYGVRFELADNAMLPVTVSIFVNSQELQAEQNAFRTGLWRSLGITGFILVLAQLVLLTLGLRPLRRITQDISGIESGKLERLEGHYPKELEPLKRNLNHLLDTEKANQTRYRNALDSLAHSLKTPLSVIRASLPSDASPKTEAMEDAVTDMQRLIATRLQRAAASTRRTMAQAVGVKVQVERLVHSLSRVYSQELINTDVKINADLKFYGEQRDLLELAGNLLDNACKYGAGQVCVSADVSDPENPRAGIKLRVEDNGPGIVNDEREQLLKRGVRGDERVEGHGLGLAIVLEIVSAYNGEISISQSDLGGACVSVSLKTR